MLNLFHMMNIQGKELYSGDFVQYILNIHLFMKQFVSNLVDKTELYNLIPVSVTVTFMQGHRVMRERKLVKSIYCKVA